MTLADRSIAALRAEHETLAGFVPTLYDEELGKQSGASDWTVAQVLSHLGSGAEIGLATLRANLGSGPPLADDFAQGVWDRWNSLSPAAQADGVLVHDAELVAAFEGLSADQRQTVQFHLGFVPFPLGVDVIAGMRLNESAMHGWDARVAIDPHAVVVERTAAVLLDHFGGGLSVLLAGAEVDGNISLDQLRRVFPGYDAGVAYTGGQMNPF